MFNGKIIHLIGIGGISMSSIALMLKNMGATVTGSDITESNITKKLIENGIIVKYGHHPKMISEADIVVFTAAISDNDPEKIAIKKLNKESYERAEFLGMMSKDFKNCICISGTHGKSTTTGMISLIFLEAKLNPTIQVGAILKEINGNTYLGGKDYLIMEACEYVDSFLHFHPTSEVITNIDNDHLDYFKNLDNIKKSFNKYTNLLPSNGYLIKNNDDTNSNNVEYNSKAKVITFGINNKSDYMAKNITINDLGHYSYDLYLKNELLCTINLSINGKHNVYNSLAALSLSHQYIKDIKIIKRALEKYHGVERRFEYLGSYNETYIFDDYAHHPSEIKTTFESVKSVKHNKSWAIFQSHTYSRTYAHLDEFAKVLSNFDNIIIAPIYPAREVNTFNISEDMLVNKIKEFNSHVVYINTFDKIKKFLKDNIKEKDLVITIGAGPINKIGKDLIKENTEM